MISFSAFKDTKNESVFSLTLMARVRSKLFQEAKRPNREPTKDFSVHMREMREKMIPQEQTKLFQKSNFF